MLVFCMGVLIRVPADLLPIQLSASVLGKTEEEDLRTCHLRRRPGSRLWPDPYLAVVTICVMNEQTEDSL